MDALVLAGGLARPGDRLYPLIPDRPKALLPLLGRPMLQWVLEALDAAQAVDRVLVFGDALETAHPWRFGKPIQFLPDGGSMVANILEGLRRLHQERPGLVLLVSGDVPTITGEIVDWVAENAHRLDVEVVYHVVERRVMEARFPGVRRTYVRFKDVEVCGADVNVVHTALALRQDDLWERLYAARKSPLRQAALLGWDLVLAVLFRRITLKEAERRIARRLRLDGVVTLSPYAELAMDVDKPEHVALAEAALRRRQAETAQAPSPKPDEHPGASA